MAPKAADASATITIDNFRFVLYVLQSAKQITPNWDEVAAQSGIKYGGNAGTKFKELVKKHGYKFEGNSLVPLDGDAAPAATTPKSPKTPKISRTPNTPRSKTTTPTAKKRKVMDAAMDGEGSKLEDEVNGNGTETGDDVGAEQHGQARRNRRNGKTDGVKREEEAGTDSTKMEVDGN